MQYKSEPGMPNEVLDCDGFFISYNPARELNPLDAILVALGTINQDNLGRPETALCFSDPTMRPGIRHLILYGDYREAYASIAHQGLDACIALFNKHIEHIADTSDTIQQRTH